MHTPLLTNLPRRLWVIVTLTSSILSAQDGSNAATPASSMQAKETDFVYELAPFDKIKISVYGEPDLATEQLVSDDGTAFIPLIGPVQVGGKTVKEATKAIEQQFISQEYLRKPVVTVSIEEFSPKELTVMGEVNEPGSITISPGSNGVPIQIAIAEAGGFKNTAKTGEVTVTRADPAADEAPLMVVNVDSYLQSKSKGENEAPFVVRAGDVVFVPRRVF